MARPRGVNEAIARFDELISRYDGQTPAAARARRRQYYRNVRALASRVANIGAALVALAVATIAFGLVVGPIGWTGLFAVSIVALFILIFFSIWPGEPKQFRVSDKIPTKALVQQLDTYLVSRRQALPAAAAPHLDAISARLPLLESRLENIDALDPLVQEARRLAGKHLPELIDRYERIPPAYRQARDAGGLTVDERLVAGLDAAHDALEDIGDKLARNDLTAFETQGRFLESRYKDSEGFKAG